MKHLYLSLLLQCAALMASAQWTNLGLNAYDVNDLSIYADTIYASTNDGIFKKSTTNTDSIWAACGMQGNHVTQTLVENHQSFYSMVTLGDENTNTIYKSENGGLTFSPLTPSASNTNLYLYLDHMANEPGDFNTLYLLDHQLKSEDGGSTWSPLGFSINTNRFIMVNPSNHAQVIVGGEGDFFNAMLQVSNDFGQTWDFPAMNSYFNGDNCVHDIAIDGNVWYAAGEGIIAKTTDEGENWEQVLNLFSAQSIYSLYYTNIAFSPVNYDILYVTGLNNTNNNEVPLLYSDNQGADWDTLHYYGEVANQKIKCMEIENIESTDWVYLGGKGVYLYQRLVTSVGKSPQPLDLSLYPNPSSKELNLQYNSLQKGPITLSIFDLQGRLIKQQKEWAVGQQVISIDISGLSQGTYLLQLADGQRIGSREFVVR